ncbi:MAG: C40 family peptidase [Chitinophagaceae bacterium]|nr:C40 family peptidase [Chitinophagaceae bacterium]MBK8952588.1 C40 family peptidase [Chitinophagaceae bacterium]
MEYAIVAVPAAPVRRKAGHSKEMVNQLLFGEKVKVLKTHGKLWAKIRSLHDGYEGWMTVSQLEEVAEKTARLPDTFITTELLAAIDFGENRMHIPVGSSLPAFRSGNGTLGKLQYKFEGQFFEADKQLADEELLKQLIKPWMNAPYLWGGRTLLGVDCSGLVQVIYKLMGINLPRDAWQQAQGGKAVKKFSELQPGDLVFFDNKEDIVHVGIYLGEDKIVHAAGKVRVDDINKKGVVNADVKLSGNRLRAIRRYW